MSGKSKLSQKKSLDRSRLSQSMSSSSQSAPLPEEELNALVADIVKFILHRHNENKVAKRIDMSQNIVKGKIRKWNELMDKVEKRFDKCFGMKLVAIGDPKVQHSLRYTLINKLKEKDGSVSLFNTPSEMAKHGFLSLILVYLFMKKDPVTEGRLLQFLRNIEVYRNEMTFEHDVLGDLKSLLKEFVDQQYVAAVDISSSNDPEHKVKHYTWGDRAKFTISKKDVFKFMGKMYNCSTDRWEAMELYKKEDLSNCASDSSDSSDGGDDQEMVSD